MVMPVEPHQLSVPCFHMESRTAPGQFQDRAAAAGAERISAPLLVEDAVAEELLQIVLQRWREGLRLLTG